MGHTWQPHGREEGLGERVRRPQFWFMYKIIGPIMTELGSSSPLTSSSIPQGLSNGFCFSYPSPIAIKTNLKNSPHYPRFQSVCILSISKCSAIKIVQIFHKGEKISPPGPSLLTDYHQDLPPAAAYFRLPTKPLPSYNSTSWPNEPWACFSPDLQKRGQTQDGRADDGSAIHLICSSPWPFPAC